MGLNWTPAVDEGRARWKEGVLRHCGKTPFPKVVSTHWLHYISIRKGGSKSFPMVASCAESALSADARGAHDDPENAMAVLHVPVWSTAATEYVGGSHNKSITLPRDESLLARPNPQI